MGIHSLILMMTLAAGAGDFSKESKPLDEGHVIVRVVGRNKTLTVGSTTHGLVYSVADGSGNMMMNGGTLEELRAKHPELWQQVQTGLALGEAPGPGEILDASIGLDAGY